MWCVVKLGHNYLDNSIFSLTAHLVVDNPCMHAECTSLMRQDRHFHVSSEHLQSKYSWCQEGYECWFLASSLDHETWGLLGEGSEGLGERKGGYTVKGTAWPELPVIVSFQLQPLTCRMLTRESVMEIDQRSLRGQKIVKMTLTHVVFESGFRL